MKKIVKNITNYIIGLSILAIVLGIVLIVYPGMSIMALGITIAVYMILLGITLVALDLRAWSLYIPFEGLLPGIICIVLGAFLAKSVANRPEVFAAYLGIVIGIWVVASGFTGIKTAAALRGTGAPCVMLIIMNIIDIIIGGVIIFSPVLSSLSLTMALGIVLIAHSIVRIIDMVTIKRNANEVEKLIVEKSANNK